MNQAQSSGNEMYVRGQDGKMHKGKTRVRDILCGKNCNGCPHGAYKYVVYRDGGKTREKYLGKVTGKKQNQKGEKDERERGIRKSHREDNQTVSRDVRRRPGWKARRSVAQK